MKEVGGQAVIEGVMMRSEDDVALAVRSPEGNIIVKHEKISEKKKRSVFRLPILRGMYSLVQALVIGVKYLTISANIAATDPKEEEGELTTAEITTTLLMAMSIGIFLFILLPQGISKLIENFITTNPYYINLLEGISRIIIFLGYVFSISRLDDIEKVFKYHGAEHKAIYAFESEEELTVENAKRYPRLHPRCGTSFLMFVMVISMLVFSVIAVDTWYIKVLCKILLMPVVAGISFEFIKMAGRNFENPIIRTLVKPGLWLQYLTTREPEDEQLEVAIAALKEAIGEGIYQDTCEDEG